MKNVCFFVLCAKAAHSERTKGRNRAANSIAPQEVTTKFICGAQTNNAYACCNSNAAVASPSCPQHPLQFPFTRRHAITDDPILLPSLHSPHALRFLLTDRGLSIEARPGCTLASHRSLAEPKPGRDSECAGVRVCVFKCSKF